MIKVFESVGELANLFDDQVEGLGAAVADAVGVEGGQDLCFPCAEAAAQPGDWRAMSSQPLVSATRSTVRRWTSMLTPPLACSAVQQRPYPKRRAPRHSLRHHR